jgi:hypothetical protein
MHTKQQIEQWARECIAEDWEDHIPGYYRDMNLTRFAELVAQREMERCAEVCIADAAPYQAAGASVAIECAAAIRSAGKT